MVVVFEVVATKRWSVKVCGIVLVFGEGLEEDMKKRKVGQNGLVLKKGKAKNGVKNGKELLPRLTKRPKTVGETGVAPHVLQCFLYSWNTAALSMDPALPMQKVFFSQSSTNPV